MFIVYRGSNRCANKLANFDHGGDLGLVELNNLPSSPKLLLFDNCREISIP